MIDRALEKTAVARCRRDLAMWTVVAIAAMVLLAALLSFSPVAGV